MAIPFIAGILSGLLFASLAKLHRLREWHHGYYGMVLVAFTYLTGPAWLIYPALVLIFDDDVQHVAEALGLVPPTDDFTPIHRLGAAIMRTDLKESGWLIPIVIVFTMFAAAVYFAIVSIP